MKLDLEERLCKVISDSNKFKYCELQIEIHGEKMDLDYFHSTPFHEFKRNEKNNGLINFANSSFKIFYNKDQAEIFLDGNLLGTCMSDKNLYLPDLDVVFKIFLRKENVFLVAYPKCKIHI